MNLPSNLFENYAPPSVFLCQPNKEIIGELQVYDLSGTFKFNTYSEIQFSVAKTYNDSVHGKSLENPYYSLIDSLRVIYILGIGHFVIQDVQENLNDYDSKTVSCFSLEYSTSTKFLDTFRINTGEDDSLEYIYHMQKNGVNYSIDKPYIKANIAFDPYERYFIKEYIDNDSYVYTEVKINNEIEFSEYDEQLYVKAFPNVRFYNPSNTALSLLHIVFNYIPEWKIGYVDPYLWFQERTFSEDRISVYDFLCNTAAETFQYVIQWDSINGVANFYATEEDGITENNEIQTRWNTDVFISRENLASQIDVKYSTDEIRTKLKVTGGDDLSIRDVNLGESNIMNLSFYNDPLWLGNDLYVAYNKYINQVEKNTEKYTTYISSWVAAYNEYNDLMNAIPIEQNVLRIGDKFELLYCLYRPIYNEDASSAEIEMAISTAKASLEKKLNLYHVNEDTKYNKKDNVLLTLENADSDSATIRVYYNSSESAYKIRRTITNATTGVISSVECSLRQWVEEEITASYLGLDNYTIKSIGTLGAYLCLMKDETKKENIEDYGIRLLKEKQSVYTKIFIAQTEGYYSKEGNQCVASDTQPTGEVADGTKWLDTDSSPLMLYIYKNSSWTEYDPTVNNENQSDYENYARYIENYEKLQVVQEVLLEKELRASYLLNGVAVKNRYFTKDKITSENLLSVIAEHFPEEYKNGTITLVGYESEFGIARFTIGLDPDNEYAVYIGDDGIPYIAYSRSQGVNLCRMNTLKKESSMENFFTEGELIRLSPFIREDEYNNSNIILTGYESEEEEISIKKTLLEEATKELKKICQPKLSFSITMANIMAIPEFAPLREQFQLGNFVKVELRENYIKRARLLDVSINFDDLSDFSCTFGDLITTKDEVDKTADLLQQAVTAGKTVAASSSSWQKAVETSTALDKAINEGLKDSALSVGSSNGQSIIWNEHGILGRKLIEGTTDQYEPEQFMLTNNRLIFTNSNWETSKGVFGTFTINGDEKFGILTDCMVGGYIEGSEIKGGSLEIGGEGGTFKVNSDGSVQILGADGNSTYATKTDFQQAIGWTTEVISDGPTIFTDKNQVATLSCKVYYQGEDKTSTISSSKFKWIRTSANTPSDQIWNSKHTGVKTIAITHSDIENNATICCKVNIETT